MRIATRSTRRAAWKRMAIALVALVAVCASSVQPASAQGFTEPGDYRLSRWSGTNTLANWNSFSDKGATRIPYYIHTDLVARGFRQPVRNAFQQYEDDPNSNVSFIYMGSTSTLSEVRIVNGVFRNVSDGINVVSFGSLPGGAPGYAGFGFDNGTTQFDITLSSTVSFAIGPVPGTQDVESIVLHELGHALGLGHPTANPGSVLGAPHIFGQTKRQLHPADLYAIRLLYPCGPDDFADAPAGLYFSQAVQWAGCTGITTGTSATLFSPHDPVSRGQMATFLWRYAGEPAAGPHGFSDVPSGAFYNEPVEWLAASGITTGTSPTTFSPNNTVTRGQMAAFLWRYAGEPAWSGGSGFSDVSPGAYYATAVAWMAGNGITTGTTATTFSPDQPLTRAQAVTFLSRYNDNK